MTLPEHLISERFVRASGPGGQNVNKVATAVELRFDVGKSDLPEDVKARLARLAGKRLGADGILLIDSRAHRAQSANREEARERLADLLRRASIRPKRRKKTRPHAASKEKRLESKTRRSRIKAGRGRVRDAD